MRHLGTPDRLRPDGTPRDLVDLRLVVPAPGLHAPPTMDLEKLLAATADGAFTTSLDGKIALWNRAAERLLGYTAREAVGRSWSDLFVDHDGNGPRHQCPFLIPVMADGLWMCPVPAYCRRPDAPVKVPARGALTRVCTTCEHVRCPGFRTSRRWEASP